MARKVLRLLHEVPGAGPAWDHVAEGAYHQFVARVTTVQRADGYVALGLIAALWSCRPLTGRGAAGSPPVPDRRPQRGVGGEPSDRRRAQGRAQGAGLEDGRDVTFDIRFTEGKLGRDARGRGARARPAST